MQNSYLLRPRVDKLLLGAKALQDGLDQPQLRRRGIKLLLHGGVNGRNSLRADPQRVLPESKRNHPHLDQSLTEEGQKLEDGDAARPFGLAFIAGY